MVGDAQAAATFQQRAEQEVIVQNLVASVFVREKLDEAPLVSVTSSECGDDETNILRGELDPAIRLNHFHTCFDARELYWAPRAWLDTPLEKAD
jgi:hypothetical protein